MLVNWHSFGPLVLSRRAGRSGRPTPTTRSTTALGGTDANPGIPGFDPGMSAEELYVTNGETTDYADVRAGSIAFTPELEEGCDGCGFVFPDNEALIQAEFEKTLPFSLDVAKSAANPANPVSHLGNTTKPFYLSQTEVDAENGGLSMFDFTFAKSYGDPQEVRVLARGASAPSRSSTRSMAARSRASRRPNGPAANATAWARQRTTTSCAATVTGTSPGNTVKVWFEGGGATSDSFTYTGRVGKRQAGADRRGGGLHGRLARLARPPRLDTSRLRECARRQRHRVRRLRRRRARPGRPDHLGVLSHYDAVIWYTGDDVITREPGWGPGNAPAWRCRSSTSCATT